MASSAANVSQKWFLIKFIVNAIFISIFLSNKAALIDDDTPGFGEEENPKQFR